MAAFSTILLSGMFLTLATVQTAAGHPSPDFSVQRISFSPSSAIQHRPGVSLPAAEYTLPISGSVPRSKARKQLRDRLRSHYSGSRSGDVAMLAGADFDEEYLVEITAGGNQQFSVIVDTGRFVLGIGVE